MIYVIVSIISIFCFYLIIKRNYGPIAGLFMVFTNLIYTLLFGISVSLYQIHTLFLLVGYFLLIILPHQNRNYKIKQLFFNPVMLSVLFFVVVMIIHDHTISHYYSIHHEDMNAFEMRYMISIVFPMLLLPFAVTNTKEKDAFVDSFMYWGCIYLLALLFTFSLSSELLANRMLLAEMTEDLLSTIFLSRLAGLVVVASFVTLFFGGKGIIKICFSMVVLVIFLFTLLLLGQRGTVIGTVLGISLLFLKRKRRKYLLFIIPIALILLIVLSQFEFSIFERFEELEDSESSSRFRDYSLVWKIFEENQFLKGLGSWGYDYYTGGREYPHNIFLEHISNYGLFGLVCVSVLYFYSMKHLFYILKYSENYRDMIICASWCVFAFSALVSSSITGQQQLYLWSALLVFIYNETKRTNAVFRKKNTISNGRKINQ